MSSVVQQFLRSESDGDAYVLTGTLDPKTSSIKTGTGGAVGYDDFSYRAMWSWLRLHIGRSHADVTIQAEKDELEERGFKGMKLREALGDVMRKMIREYNTDREVQYIMKGDHVYAVASTNHLLIPPSLVLETAQRVIPEPTLWSPDQGALVSEIEELAGLRLDFGLDPGNILTRRAIRVGYAVTVLACTNPLSWLYGGENEKFFDASPWTRYKNNMSRVLRIDRPESLDDRILEAYNKSVEGKDMISNDVDRAKSTELTTEEAKILGTAFPVSYGAGQKVVKQIMDRYTAEKASGTLWGLAMAVSYVAKHGERSQRATHAFTRNLGGASAGYLWIEDKKAVVDKASDWLKDVKKIDLKEWF